MMINDILLDYGLFFLKTLTVLITALLIIAATKSQKDEKDQKVKFTPLNKQKEKDIIANIKEIYEKKEQKSKLKEIKCKTKKRKKNNFLFIINFKGDIKANQVEQLRQEVSAILEIAKPSDQVLVTLESPGGQIAPYGLAASQLARFKGHNIPLTVAIDQVAASGGYLMACVADHILAAPFAMIGSIGVVMQLPNFHHWLKKHDIEFEQLTAGQFKRTLSAFGKNSEQGRSKALEQIEDIHTIFKQHVKQFRSKVDIAKVATGEVWLGNQALKLKLIDKIQTSDDFISQAFHTHQIVEVKTPKKTSKIQQILKQARNTLSCYFDPDLLNR